MTNPNANPRGTAGRHRAPAAAPALTTDTDPDNPVNDYEADTFPLGAALTVAYGSTEMMFCTLGNLYRIVGYLTGDLPSIEGDPNAVPPIPSLADEINRCAVHVMAQLPEAAQRLTLPDNSDGDNARMEWLIATMTAAGTTVTLTPLPTTEVPDA